MVRSRDTDTTPVSVNFSSEEKRMLDRRAEAAERTLGEYIRERVLAEPDCEEGVLRFLVDELARVVGETRQGLVKQEARTAPGIEGSPESRAAQRARIAREVSKSLTQDEWDALGGLFRSEARE